MSDDLVKRLRDWMPQDHNSPCYEAADRIEELERAVANCDIDINETRREALEEAAQIAERTKSSDDNGKRDAGLSTTGQFIAVAIRALKEK